MNEPKAIEPTQELVKPVEPVHESVNEPKAIEPTQELVKPVEPVHESVNESKKDFLSAKDEELTQEPIGLHYRGGQLLCVKY